MSVDPSWKDAYKITGLSLLVSGLILIVFIAGIIATQQELPPPAEEALDDPDFLVGLFIVAIVGELLLLPSVLGLYLSLKEVDKSRMLIATALWSTAVFMFLVSRALIISLLPLSDLYTSASSEMKATYLALAEFAIELENIFATIALILLSVASIIIGWVMLKTDIYDNRLGYLTMVAGGYTIFTPFAVVMGFVLLGFIGLVLSLAWQLWAGVVLYKLG
ncbi:MAG: DUF4386 family protein [Candidatus Hodarchaeales archaeon]|jgi:hypothetical protein